MVNNSKVDEDVLSGRIAIIGSRTDDTGRRPIMGSTPSTCVECKRDVMLSPATRRRMIRLSVVLCIDCAVAVANGRDMPWIDPGYNEDQLQEMEANGIKPERWYGDNK